MIGRGISRRPLHDVRLGVLVGHADRGDHVRAEIDRQDQNRTERHGREKHDPAQERRDLRDIRRQRVADALLQIVENEAAGVKSSSWAST